MNFYPQAWISMAEALLIGLLVGVERESDRAERHAGLRDFVTIGLAGGLCGLLGVPALTIGALAAITAYLIVFRLQTPGRTGITTEIAAVATFLLCVLTATHSLPWGSPLAIALTVILALTLDARESLRKFFLEVITEKEFHDTLRFLAVIFVILPVLPDGGYGPYTFFNPRSVWMFVILVCSISYAGYFLEKFFGEERGLAFTAMLGGVASTTASTVAFARQAAEDPEQSPRLARAAILSNSVQAPRIFALLFIVAPQAAWAAAPELGAICLAGLALAFLPGRAQKRNAKADSPSAALPLRNPFSLIPALKFGALFALVRLLARGASAEFGSAGVMAASLLGGSIDVDAIAFTVSGMARDNAITLSSAKLAVLLAFASNAVLKTVLAYTAGGRRYGLPVMIGFICMIAAGAAVLAFF